MAKSSGPKELKPATIGIIIGIVLVVVVIAGWMWMKPPPHNPTWNDPMSQSDYDRAKAKLEQIYPAGPARDKALRGLDIVRSMRNAPKPKPAQATQPTGAGGN